MEDGGREPLDLPSIREIATHVAMAETGIWKWRENGMRGGSKAHGRAQKGKMRRIGDEIDHLRPHTDRRVTKK